MSRYLRISVLIGLLLFLFLTPSLHAQAILTHQSGEQTVAVEALKPAFDNDQGVEFATSAWFLSGLWQFNDNWAFTAELPLARYGQEVSVNGQPTVDISETTVGNLYAGIRYGHNNGPFMANLGIRLPFAEQDKLNAELAGRFSDVERWDAFIPNALGFIGTGQYRYQLASGFFVGARGGGSFLVNTDKDEGEDASDLYLLYGLSAGYRAPRFDLTADFSGRFLATNDEGGFGANSWHFAGISATYKAGRIWPGVQFKLPLDKDSRDVVDFVGGVHFLINLK
ncbi:MAG: hypothetical protein D6715_03210 [Calditrichaeota bacterium]|nr:MAG: hypothetical protein D6715_03210 [Calditrichota bacterium]